MPKYQIEISIKEEMNLLSEHPNLEQALTHVEGMAETYIYAFFSQMLNRLSNGDYQNIDVSIKEQGKRGLPTAVRFSVKKDRGDDAE